MIVPTDWQLQLSNHIHHVLRRVCIPSSVYERGGIAKKRVTNYRGMSRNFRPLSDRSDDQPYFFRSSYVIRIDRGIRSWFPTISSARTSPFLPFLSFSDFLDRIDTLAGDNKTEGMNKIR